MKLPVLSVHDVVRNQLCTGCGACAYIDPSQFHMADVPSLGRRPLRQQSSEAEKAEALEVCPGYKLKHTFEKSNPIYDTSLVDAWGPVIKVWEGYAADSEVRNAGSSGGVATALALYCIEQVGMHGVLHTKADDQTPYLNTTTLSTTRDMLLKTTGSRYAPASPCDGLAQIEHATGPCVFIGKPCDVAATNETRKLRPALDANLALTIAFFCAGTPSTQGTTDLLRKAGVSNLKSITGLRYRGNGWPGRWVVDFTDESGQAQSRSMSYTDSWDFLQRYRQWRCYICPDHTGEFADIAVGDPWHREPTRDEPGRSLILARTQRGLDVLLAAANAGYIVLEREDNTLLPKSQPNILVTRANNWGRLLALRVWGAPVPKYTGFPMFKFWITKLSFKQRIQSIVGTVRRIKSKGLKHPVELSSPSMTTQNSSQTH